MLTYQGSRLAVEEGHHSRHILPAVVVEDCCTRTVLPAEQDCCSRYLAVGNLVEDILHSFAAVVVVDRAVVNMIVVGTLLRIPPADALERRNCPGRDSKTFAVELGCL
jgi:hypothetical protein